MKRTLTAVIALLVCIPMLFAACSRKASESANYAPGAPDLAYSGDEALSGNVGSDAPESASSGDVLQGRKVIRDAELTVQTLEFDKLLDALNAKVNELGGYVESRNVRSNEYYDRYYYGGNMRRADMVLRIPAEKLDEFLNTVDGLGNVTSRNEKVSDVTDHYTDTEAKLSSLRTEYDTLLGLLEKADSLDYIITVQDRLSQVRYEMESLEGKLANYDSLIAFSTVTLAVYEVERETPVEQETFGQEISRRFKESAEDVGDGLRNFAAWLIGDSPIIIIWLVIIAAIVAIILIVIKAIRKRRQRKAAKAYKTAESAKNAE